MKTLMQYVLLVSLFFVTGQTLSAQPDLYSPSYGGNGGNAFVLPRGINGATIENYNQVQRISVKHGRYIEQIKISWLVNNNQVTYAAGGDRNGSWSHIDLRPGEYITGITGTADQFINSLTIYTNTRRQPQSFGEPSGRSFRIAAPRGKQIIGFYGQSGQLIDHLGALFAKVQPSRSVENGMRITSQWVYLESKVNRLHLDVQGGSTQANAPIWMFTPNGTLAQQWKFISAGNGYYFIQARGSGLYLNVKMDSRKSGAFIWQRPFTRSVAQQWKPIDAGNGYVYLQSRLSGLYLDVRGAGMNPRTEVWQHPLNRTNAQKWRFKPVTRTTGGGKVTDHRISDADAEAEWYKKHGLDPQKGGG